MCNAPDDCFSCANADKTSCFLASINEQENTRIVDYAKFISVFEEVQGAAHLNAVEKGFWDEDKNDAEFIALAHAELSWALEAMRNGNQESVKVPGFSCIEEELSDVILRIMDYSGGNNLNVAGAIVAKMGYNKNRPWRHGKKF